MEIKSNITGRRGVSLPFSDSCEPIVSGKNDFGELFRNLLVFAEKSGWRYLELRGGKNYLTNCLPLLHYYTHMLNFDQSKEKIFKSFRGSTRRNIRKAAKEHVHVKILNSFDALKKFYRLHCITRKHHGVPPQPFLFFKKIHDHVLSKNYGIVVLGYFREKVIAAAVFFHFGNKAIYKYGASDKNYQNLRANNLIMWQALKWYLKRGYQEFSFGRTEPDNRGLLQFKDGWCNQRTEIKYYKYDLKSKRFETQRPSLNSFHTKIFRRMPLSMLNIVGSMLYRHIG
jgi:lipid II:glycine glycyltransferase (peptidoglycan interpeptide bridge formation enzyme)